ncbi:LuxR C-terminal-related transcriptional regulator [Streptomyces sp. NBC_01353]|uniref:LuxR C-terminal-related transcriptional regulator n=1 Tax=Streptomyces sp. NBC_01353 TaxID=2903835 RepID=UPI002E369618|nr:LuxR C-terminal-related transcriptional regulator [Streptomyces sp. NBC_01353]
MADLTGRERAVVLAAANGTSYRDLAHQWGIEEITVRGYGHRAIRKLGGRSIAHAVFLACQAGILDGRPRRHGDHAGYVAHIRRGEDPKDCEPCRTGERAYRNGLDSQRHDKEQAA